MDDKDVGTLIMLERCKAVVSKAFVRAQVAGDPKEEMEALGYLYSQLSAKPQQKKEEEKPATGDE